MRSIRIRLIVAMLSLIVVLTGVLSVTFIQQTASSVVTSQHKALTRIAGLVAGGIGTAVAQNDGIAIRAALAAIRDMDDVTGARVAAPDGTVLFQIGNVLPDETGAVIGLPAALRMFEPLLTHMFPARGLTATVPVVDRGETVATLALQVETTAVRSELMRVAALAVAIAILVGIVGTVSAMALQTMITRPLHKLALAMDIAGRTGRYTETIPEDGPNETAVIARTYNAMIMRIGARDKVLQDRKAELESKVMSRTRDLEVAKNSAESANSAKSVFLATMSHEIRTPLNGMLVMAELLARSKLDPKHRRYAEVIESSGRTLVNIINDVLDLSKIEAGALTIDPIPVSPHKIVADVIDIFAEKAASKDLDLAGYVHPEVPDAMVADPVRLKQILSNFVNNAIKFTAEGYVYVEVNTKDGRLLVSVHDTGIGIRPENKARIFEPFSQEDGSTMRKYGGTGLGLSICRKLVDAMGGEIGFESEPDQGTVFYFQIPCIVSKSAEGLWPQLPIGALADISIGVLASESIGTRVMAQTLTDSGVAVEEIPASDSDADALDRFDLIIGSPDDMTSFVEILAPENAHLLRDKLVCAAPASNGRREWLRENGHAGHTLDLPASRDVLVRDLQILIGAYDDEGSSGEAGGLEVRAPDMRALVADDNAVNREVMAAILDQFEISGTFASDGEEALQKYRSTGFDVVFMDINMPGMDGIQATRRIRQFEDETGGTRTPVIALTAHGETLDDRSWSEHGFDHYVGKPVRVLDIQKALLDLGLAEARHGPVEAAGTDNDAPVPSTDNLIDWSVMEDLTHTLDAAQRESLCNTVLGLYCSDAPGQLSALFLAMDSDDAEEIRMAAHALKSVSLNVGAVKVAGLTAEIEAQARDGKFEATPELRTRLDELVSGTIQALGSRLRTAA